MPRWVGGESVNTAAIPYNRAVSRCVRSSRAWRERSRAGCTPQPSGSWCLPRMAVWRYRQSWRRASGSTNAVFLNRAVSVPSSHNRLASSSVVAARQRLDERCIPRPSGFRAFLAQPSCVIASRGGARAVLPTLYSLSERLRAWRRPQSWPPRERPGRTLYSSSERLPCLALPSVVDGVRAVLPTLYSSSERPHRALPATRERFDERCTPRPSGFPPRAARCLPGPLS